MPPRSSVTTRPPPRWITPAEVTTAVDTRAASRPRRFIMDEVDSSPTVCKACQQIFADAELVSEKWKLPVRNWRGIGELHKRLEDLYHAADDGCHICECIVESAGTTKVTDYMIESGGYTNNMGVPYLALIIAYKKRLPQVIWFYLGKAELKPFTGSVDCLSAAQPSTASPETLSLAKHWLETCKTEHLECARASGPRWYPTRLLRLHAGRARLIHPASDSLNEPYATLSHCWGGNRFENLTSCSYDRFQKGFPVESFLPSFRHAMEICLSLGVRLIWIDCFCIIQGQDAAAVADWERESVRMEHVYANGTFNIAAARASGPEDGCFSERNARLPTALIRCPASTTTRVVLRKKEVEMITHTSRGRIQGEPLWTRGWVFQERLICRRLLTFGAGQIRWNCVTSSASELAQWQEDGVLGPSFFPRNRIDDDESDLQRAQRLENSSSKWANVTSDYGRKCLSYPGKDKLRALQAATDRAERLLNIRILYGHTVHNILATLHWQTTSFSKHDLHSTGKHSRIDQMPSWSWASIDGPVTYGRVFDRPARSFQALAMPILPTISPSNDLSCCGQSDFALVFVGRLLAARLLGRASEHLKAFQLCRVGTQNWELNVHYDDDSEYQAVEDAGTRLWVCALDPVVFGKRQTPAKWSGEGKAPEILYYVLILVQKPDGTYRRFGLATAAVGAMEEMHASGKYQGLRLSYVSEWYQDYRKLKPRIFMLV